jgi:large subunit ribosomal protein L23|tara:strand:- start:1533 stop:1832 length:300 start_codon:yes stop_codon:yes gene_type:complete
VKIMVDPFEIIIMPWITEKTLEARRVADPDIGYVQNNNRIEFIVHREATKRQIKQAVEELFEVKVAKVNTRITITGKHASVRLAEGYDAEEAALKLGAF